MKLLGSIIAICISAPIWLYLLYKILEAVQATELMWFLYYAYIPAVLFGAFIAVYTSDSK